MSRSSTPLDPATGEPLYDVFNNRGLALLLGVTHTAARQAVKQHWEQGDKQWAGNLVIAMAQRGPAVLELRTSIVRVTGRLEVWCDVDRLLPSGLTVAELFTKVPPQLVAAIEEAAARAPTQPPARRAVGMSMDVGAAAPGIVLQLHDPAACAADIAGQLDYLQRIVEKVLDGQRHATSGASAGSRCDRWKTRGVVKRPSPYLPGHFQSVISLPPQCCCSANWPVCTPRQAQTRTRFWL